MAIAVNAEFLGARRRLVQVLRANGIFDPTVLKAVEQTPRHLFVPTGVRHRAYDDTALQIGQGQTISQPTIHARYLELLKLKGTERVLEIGTGSGYQTVLLSHLASQVFTIERVAPLMERAREVIRDCGARNVSFLLGDGTIGWRDYAPYDAILVSAAAPELPQPLVDQLAVGGVLLIPLGDRHEQMLTMVTKLPDRVERRDIVPVRFVPLVGTHGWSSQ
ncbi:MAG: protein-L-isoaspartate(D-aspartate) O-methyltransferase [Gemmatimonadaceae bacterium]|nr:protein-L-isoaspartate(D-aspartate) O-methyltransferase [Gemmatimonadaceae bacterium]